MSARRAFLRSSEIFGTLVTLQNRTDVLLSSRVQTVNRTAVGALVVAEVVSTLGSRMTYLALPWFVLVTTGSPGKMSIVLAVQLAPMALLRIPSGSVVQRLGGRTTMLLSDIARVPLMAA